MQKFYTDRETGVTITLDGLTVVGELAGYTWQRFNREAGPLWARPESMVPAPGTMPEQLEAAYQEASRHAVPVRPENRRNLRSACFQVAAKDGLTARDVARELAEMFGWRVTETVNSDDVVAAARELGIELPAPAESNHPGACPTPDCAEYGCAAWTAAEGAEHRPELAPRTYAIQPDGQLGPERVTCAQVEVGDLIGQRKAGPFHRVTQVRAGERSAYLTLAGERGDYRIRPQHATKLWRQVSA